MALVELSPREQEELLWKIKHSKDANQALLWLSQGESVTSVASRQHVSRQTVYNWIEGMFSPVGLPSGGRGK